ncbi:MAG TPA: hypothetical protein VI873_03480 [Candidatus Peribacteraceae bacterium]|nr:hypothetical protein [Candidatus Peribacteraceae bacterium]
MSDIALLQRARDGAKSLHLHSEIESLPNVPVDCASLKGKKIVLLDDSPDVFAAFFLPLFAATEGACSFLWHQNESQQELIERVTQGDIVLIDEYLANNMHGHTLVPELLKRKPNLTCIGFSNTARKESIFLAAGAHGFVTKDPGDPWGTLKRVAAII